MSYSTIKPPPGAQVRWGAPLAKDLYSAFLFNQGQPLYDAANQYVSGGVGGGQPDWIGQPSPKGQSVRITGNGYYFVKGRGTRATSIFPKGFSIAFQLKRDAIGGLGTLVDWGLINPQLRFNASKMNLLANATSDMAYSSTTLTSGEYFHGGVSYLNPIVSFYLNGKPDGTTSSAQSFNTYPTAYSVGAKTSGAEALGLGNLLYLYVWERVLSPAEFKQIAEAPYEMWAPQSPARFFTVGGGAAASKAYYYSQTQGLR